MPYRLNSTVTRWSVNRGHTHHSVPGARLTGQTGLLKVGLRDARRHASRSTHAPSRELARSPRRSSRGVYPRRIFEMPETVVTPGAYLIGSVKKQV